MPIIEMDFDILCILTILLLNVVVNDWNLDEKLLVSETNCNIVFL